ncbi:MAG: PIG-L family deacetylase [Clostridia bacterium]|nr:PIG-L family deacetylase [Clostridia bacterium]
MKRARGFWLLIGLFLLLLPPAWAEEAQDITDQCRVTATTNLSHAVRALYNRYDRYWQSDGGHLIIRLPEGKKAQGLSLSFYGEAGDILIEAQDAAGEWQPAGEYHDRFLNAYVKAAGENALRLSATGDQGVRINGLSVWGEGELPASVQRWTELTGEADLLQIVTHPDDDLIWFGGLLPTYAGELQKKVMVAYAAAGTSQLRKNELLDGLWTCGVTYYPAIGDFADFHAKNAATAARRWGEGRIEQWCVSLIRRYRPQVVVTHDLEGESGHAQHILVANAVVRAVMELAGDPAYDDGTEEGQTAYTPDKLYLHRYRQNEIVMDWTRPLSRFGGKSGFEIARQAFKKHVSQSNTHYAVYLSGPNDSRRLGLYFTQVGPDERKDDLFEHCEPRGTE